MALWFTSTGHTARLTVTLEELTAHFIAEGIAEGVRGDIAFAQSILETGYFSYPDYGMVRVEHNNYAGIGACNSCETGYIFESAQIGVRAQIQHLRNYADPTSNTSNLANPPVLSNYNTFFYKGDAPNWEDLNGKWAVPGTTYAQKILGIYAQMLTYAGVTDGCAPDAPLGTPQTAGAGYWMFASDGEITAFGGAAFLGDMDRIALARPVVGMESTPSGQGYWMVASDGGIFSFGDAIFRGSTGAIALNKPIVGMERTPSGLGYWLVASDGGIFSFGDAEFHGSTGAMTLNQPIVGMATTSTGLGYWLVASDGGIFSFGDAIFRGSTGAIKLNRPIVAMARTDTGFGYWMVASDGGIFSFGDAVYFGSLSGCIGRVATGISPSSTGGGYWITSGEGRVATFGDAKHFGWPFVGDLPPIGLVPYG